VHALSGPNDKLKIVTPYYQALRGDHLHQGFCVTGDESLETAQVQLIEHPASLADIKSGSGILDIGCGMGASSLYLAKHFHVSTVGVTISPVQIEMATKAAAENHADSTFFLMDAEAMTFDRQFDLLWSIESISRYQDREKFSASAANLLKPGGTLGITDWFKKENLRPEETRKFIEPGMFAELQAMDEYESYLISIGLQVTHRQILKKNCAKTWNILLEISKRKFCWDLAKQHGPQFLTYWKAFHAMRAGFSSGNFVYHLLVATVPLSCGSK
jgi:cyclopropane fatty-acyl-phospholipid synthase-like methyltransferase